MFPFGIDGAALALKTAEKIETFSLTSHYFALSEIRRARSSRSSTSSSCKAISLPESNESTENQDGDKREPQCPTTTSIYKVE